MSDSRSRQRRESDGRLRDWMLSAAVALVLVALFATGAAIARGEPRDALLSIAAAIGGVLLWRWRRGRLERKAQRSSGRDT